MNAIDLKENLKKFVKEIMWKNGTWCDGIDGQELQDTAEIYGLIDQVEQTEPCCAECKCKETFGEEAFPLMCYIWAEGMKE